MSEEEQGAKQKPSSLKETIITVFLAILIALGVRTIAYEPFNIPSGSMIPTLLVGDYLFVSKASYGYSRHSLPFSLPLIPGRIFFEEPKRGDVMVFKLPTDNKTDYIKRIIGLPGETIRLELDRVMIDGHLLDEEYVRGGSARPQSYALEIALASDEYFVLGDDRSDSWDSRRFGPVRRDLLVGVAWLRYWPPARWGILRRRLSPRLS